MAFRHATDNFTLKYRYDVFEPSHQMEKVFESLHKNIGVFYLTQ